MLFAVLLAAIGIAIIVSANVTPFNDETKSSIITKTPSESIQYPLDLNKATAAQLATIDGIGEVLAGRIVEYRLKNGDFTDVNQLINVEGIGPQKLEVLQGFLFVEKDENTTTTTVGKETYLSTKTTTVTTEKVKPTTTVTTKKPPATKATKKTATKTTPKATTPAPQRHPVKINTATFEEIKEGLLLTDEEAEAIVRLREQIQYFSNALEILYATDKQTGREIFSNDEFNKFKDYVIVD